MAESARPRRHALAVELTPYCNQKCSYCYNDWRGDKSEARALSTETLTTILGRALDEVAFDHVTLTGGEPFARADIFEILELLRSKGTRALIISNGGLITDAIAEKLAPFRPYFVQVTLDGPTKEIHEAHVNGEHFDATISGIEALTRQGVKVCGCIVVTRKNAHHVGATLEKFASLGVRDIALSRFSPAGYAATHTAELLPSRSDLLDALRQAHTFADGMRIQVTMPIPPCVIDTKEFPKITFSSCPIGTEAQEFALGTDGKLRNCTLHATSLGDGHTDNFAAMVTSPKVAQYRDVTPEFCAPCPMRASCIGGCGAAAAATDDRPSEFAGLDPFVAQHVDDALAARLAAARRDGAAYVPLGRARRRGELPIFPTTEGK